MSNGVATIYDMDETARLILMDLPSRSMVAFAGRLREYHPEASVLDLQAIWEKYMGMDGRRAPTHDLETGNRL